MALIHICSEIIICEEKIRIPKEDGANSYDLKSGEIRFFYINPQLNKKELPLQAIEMSFNEYEKHFHNVNYGEPAFYNEEGSILKDCNNIRLWTSQ